MSLGSGADGLVLDAQDRNAAIETAASGDGEVSLGLNRSFQTLD
jgi:hypothetical protein